MVQFASLQTKQLNIQKAKELVTQAAQEGAEVVCLQELFMTDYFCFEENPEAFELADDFKTSTDLFQMLECSKENDIVLIASGFEKRTEGLYHNSTIVFDRGEVSGIYRKQHIPDDPGYYEKYYFAPGDGGYQVFDTSAGKIGVLICWDQWYPEAARAVALKGAEVIFYPTAIGWDMNDSEEIREEELEAWKTMHKAHSIANGIPIVAVNRVGEENGLKFWGSSIAVNAFGKVLLETSVDNQEVHVLELKTDQSSFYRHRWPFLRDRRIDTYQPLLKRFDDE